MVEASHDLANPPIFDEECSAKVTLLDAAPLSSKRIPPRTRSRPPEKYGNQVYLHIAATITLPAISDAFRPRNQLPPPSALQADSSTA